MDVQTTPVSESVSLFWNITRTAFPEVTDKLKNVETVDAIWEQLPAMTKCSLVEVVEKIAQHAQLPAIDTFEVDKKAAQIFPAKFISDNEIAPFALDDEIIRIAISDPFNKELEKKLRFITNYHIEFYLAAPARIEQALHGFFSNSQHASVAKGVLVIQEGHPAGTNQNAVVALARRLLSDAVKLGASDLHIQPFMGGGEIRVRVDGILRRVALIPLAVYKQLCRFFKANSGMDPSNDMIPQDGRLTLDVSHENYELRLSVLPAKGGERLVIRFLDQNRSFTLDNSGFAVAEVQKIRELVNYPSGIILLTGPTGSGKTSTLYSLLGELNNPELNILTIENPVEYQLPGISQVEINAKAGLTFANTLRSTLRQDPDIIMLGEIRDSETAEIATRAALTGHLVLSTVHTNDALTAITRLVDLGIPNNVVADSLIGVISQRLCRQLCPQCRQETSQNPTLAEQTFKAISKILPPYRAVGCSACSWTGYQQRLPVCEILNMRKTGLKTLIENGQVNELATVKHTLNDFTTINSSAVRHIISGDTTPEEATRVLGIQFWESMADEYETAIPDLTAISGSFAKQSGDVILVLSESSPSATLSEVVSANWMRLMTANTSAEAKEVLQKHTECIFVVVDIPDRLTDEQVIDYIHTARTDMAWSRLPALLLLPEGRDHLEQALIDDGATSPCVSKAITAQSLIRAVKSSLSSNRVSA